MEAPPSPLSSRPKRTRISCHAAPDKTACAPFFKERRMMFANATNFYRKSGAAQWRDLCVDATSWKCFSIERSGAEWRWRDLRFFFSGRPGYELAVILRMVLVVLMPFTVGTISTRPPQVVISSAPTMVEVV